MANKGKRIRSKRINPKKKNATSFKPGHKASAGNRGAKGFSSYDVEELAARVIDKRMVSRYLTVNSHLTRDQLRERMGLPSVSILERAVIRSLLRVAATGDFGVLDNMFDRMIGKVPNKIEQIKSDPFEGKTIDELMQMKRELTEANIKTLRAIEQTERVKQQERAVIEITARTESASSPRGDN